MLRVQDLKIVLGLRKEQECGRRSGQRVGQERQFHIELVFAGFPDDPRSMTPQPCILSYEPSTKQRTPKTHHFEKSPHIDLCC